MHSQDIGGAMALDDESVEQWEFTDEGLVPVSAGAARACLRYGDGQKITWAQQEAARREEELEDGYTHVRLEAAHFEDCGLPDDCESVQVAVDFEPGYAGSGDVWGAASDLDCNGCGPSVGGFGVVLLYLRDDRVRTATETQRRAIVEWCNYNESWIADQCQREVQDARAARYDY